MAGRPDAAVPARPGGRARRLPATAPSGWLPVPAAHHAFPAGGGFPPHPVTGTASGWLRRARSGFGAAGSGGYPRTPRRGFGETPPGAVPPGAGARRPCDRRRDRAARPSRRRRIHGVEADRRQDDGKKQPTGYSTSATPHRVGVAVPPPRRPAPARRPRVREVGGTDPTLWSRRLLRQRRHRQRTQVAEGGLHDHRVVPDHRQVLGTTDENRCNDTTAAARANGTHRSGEQGRHRP